MKVSVTKDEKLFYKELGITIKSDAISMMSLLLEGKMKDHNEPTPFNGRNMKRYITGEIHISLYKLLKYLSFIKNNKFTFSFKGEKWALQKVK